MGGQGGSEGKSVPNPGLATGKGLGGAAEQRHGKHLRFLQPDRLAVARTVGRGAEPERKV